MRITNNIIHRTSVARMQTGLREIAAAQAQVSTGLRLQKASDDPGAASAAMRTRGSLRALDQYQRNVDLATSKATAESDVLNQLSELLMRVKELGISQGGDTASAATREATAAEVDELLKFAADLGNSVFGDEYLFGGVAADAPPFDPDATDFLRDSTRPPTGTVTTEISANRYLEASHNGEQVFLGGTGLLQALRSMSNGLRDPADPKAGIATALGEVDTAFDALQGLIGENGARVNQLDVTSSNLDALSVNLQTLKADLEEAEFETAVTELVNRQTTFQAAMIATSRVMGLTLADYLR